MNFYLKAGIFIVGFLVFGASNSVLSKVLYKLISPGYFGIEVYFEKPWFVFYSEIADTLLYDNYNLKTFSCIGFRTGVWFVNSA